MYSMRQRDAGHCSFCAGEKRTEGPAAAISALLHHSSPCALISFSRLLAEDAR